jgi:hypothetical protein
MKALHLHSWGVTPAQAREIQIQLRERMQLDDRIASCRIRVSPFPSQAGNLTAFPKHARSHLAKGFVAAAFRRPLRVRVHQAKAQRCERQSFI